MDYRVLANKIIDGVGGIENIKNISHCISRLRFTLKDKDKVNIEMVSRIKGVYGVVEGSEQFQVVVGCVVDKVFSYIEIKRKEKTEDKRSFRKIGLYIRRMVMLRGVHKKRTEKRECEWSGIDICAPVKGEFSMLKGVNGVGVEIRPESEVLVAPTDSVVISIERTENEIELKANSGAEIYLRIAEKEDGANKGCFEVYAEEGDRLRMGDALIGFKAEKILAVEHPLKVYMVITNADGYNVEVSKNSFAMEQRAILRLRYVQR